MGKRSPRPRDIIADSALRWGSVPPVVSQVTRLLRDMLMLLAVASALWLFHLYARTLADAVLLAVWLLLAVVISIGLTGRKRVRRRSFLAVYIVPGSPLQRLLRGGWLMALVQLCLSLFLAAFLGIAAVRSDGQLLWAALIAAAPLLAIVRGLIAPRAARHVQAGYLAEFSLRLTLPLVGLPLLACLVALAMQASYPDFQGISLERAVWYLVGQEAARSDTLLLALQVAAAAEGLRLWLAQQLLPALGEPVWQWSGWLIMFVREALFVWSYLLLLQGVLWLLWNKRNTVPEGHTGEQRD